MSKLSVDFKSGEFSRKEIHDTIVGAMKGFQNIGKLSGGADKKPNRAAKENRAQVENEIRNLNTLGKQLEDKSVKLKAFADYAKNDGFTQAEVKALYNKSQIMKSLGKAAKNIRTNITVDKAASSFAKDVVKATAEIAKCGKDEVPVADDNIKELEALNSTAVLKATSSYAKDVTQIKAKRRSKAFEVHFGKAGEGEEKKEEVEKDKDKLKTNLEVKK